MKVSTTLTSLAAAAALVGTIGITYAQTSGGTYQTPQQAQMGGTDGTPNNNSNMNNATTNSGATTPGTGTMGSTGATGSNQTMGAQADLAPQADRN